MKSTAFVTILLLISSTSYAQAPDLGPHPVELKASEPAPFDGTLFTKERALLMSKRANNAQRDTVNAVTLVTNLMQVKIDKAERDLEIKIELGEEKEKLWRKRLDAVEHWWERPIVVGPVAVGLTVLAIYMARETIIEVHGD